MLFSMDRKVTPAPPKQPTPKPTPTPRAASMSDPWVPYRKEAAKKDPKPTGLKEPFDLYIDSVRFIPDNASVIKVSV